MRVCQPSSRGLQWRGVAVSADPGSNSTCTLGVESKGSCGAGQVGKHDKVVDEGSPPVFSGGDFAAEVKAKQGGMVAQALGLPRGLQRDFPFPIAHLHQAKSSYGLDRTGDLPVSLQAVGHEAWCVDAVRSPGSCIASLAITMGAGGVRVLPAKVVPVVNVEGEGDDARPEIRVVAKL